MVGAWTSSFPTRPTVPVHLAAAMRTGDHGGTVVSKKTIFCETIW
jgi:hypothetical protein